MNDGPEEGVSPTNRTVTDPLEEARRSAEAAYEALQDLRARQRAAMEEWNEQLDLAARRLMEAQERELALNKAAYEDATSAGIVLPRPQSPSQIKVKSFYIGVEGAPDVHPLRGEVR